MTDAAVSTICVYFADNEFLFASTVSDRNAGIPFPVMDASKRQQLETLTERGKRITLHFETHAVPDNAAKAIAIDYYTGGRITSSLENQDASGKSHNN